MQRQGGKHGSGRRLGGGMALRTVLVVGTMRPDFKFQVQFARTYHAHEDPNHVVNELAQQCPEFEIDAIAAPGNARRHVYSRLLFEKTRPRQGLYEILYSAIDQPSTPDGLPIPLDS